MRGVPSQYLAVLTDLVGASGGDLLQDIGLSTADVLIPDRWIEHNVFEMAVARAYDLTANPALGLDFGQRLNISSHTALGYAAMNSETLDQAITLLLRYHRIIAVDMALDFRIDGAQCYFTLRDNTGDTFPPGFAYETLFAAVHSSIHFLLQAQQALPVWFEIAATAPAYANRYHELLGPNVRFDQPAHRLGCATELLSASLSGANPGLVRVYEAQCEELLARMDQGAPVAEKVRVILEGCEGAFPAHDETAGLLALSPRTLRRRLADENTSFQALLDGVRSERAVKYLRETRLPLSSIAYMLGFNDASNFRRAFQRWTGNPPLHYRQHN